MGIITTADSPQAGDLLQEISSDRLRATVEKLAGFHTRNTLSPGLTEAAEWLASEYRKIPGVEAELMKYVLPKGRRVPEDKEVVQVVAKLRGTAPDGERKVVIVGGHLDSLNLEVDPVSGRAPGANDDASGVALSLELARVMSTRKWKHDLVFVGFSGEEQGLNGARALARRARAEGWRIEAMLNNDTVGSSGNLSGQRDEKHVRVFSDEPPVRQADAEPGPLQNSRELARYIEFVTRKAVPDFSVKLVLRRDRFGRGGDHTPFSEEGFSAVRFIEVHEEYTRQHTPHDLPEFMDWRYLANVTRANLVAMTHLADAGAAPENVRIDTKQGHDTTLTWKAQAGVRYVVYWRDTASAVWQGSFEAGEAAAYTVKGINKDDHFFAVGAENGVPIAAR
ncbi:MAG TPA: M20/M25/M40 family metallo-hydrolase [Fimbriimonadaceae bacterium]|nr:M20/M25/M40 family metallo-hydrolase [Fimbriimonadaceae bacterium]